MSTEASVINIILADDHELFRDGFRSLIDKNPGINMVAEASNGEQLLQLTERYLPDVILTDIVMPVMGGIEATRHISKKFPQVGIIALSMYNEEHYVKDMMEAGAKGHLLKNAGKEEIIKAIDAVNKDTAYYCRDTTLKIAKLISKDSQKVSNGLTEKEKRIIVCICQQLSNKKIGEILFHSVRTIEGYRKRIMQKTQTANPVALTIFAIKNNIIYLDANGDVQPFTKSSS